MTTCLPSYDESIQLLRERNIIGGEESPPQPRVMPQPDDEEPAGLSFFRMGFAADSDLSGLSIARTFFGRSKIAEVSFRGSDLSESNLRWNDFIDVDFTNAILANADLRASDYERATFDGPIYAALTSATPITKTARSKGQTRQEPCSLATNATS